jgi:23S rRNA (uridine2552-2'-O)-methyltransferase
MACLASGHKGTDHLRFVALCEAAAELGLRRPWPPAASFVAKVLQGGAEAELPKAPQARLREGVRT